MKVPETDELLLYNTIQGDTGAYGKLVERYQHDIYNLACRMVNDREDARDITQETFIKAFSALSSFRYESSFKTWINRIAANLCLDWLRRNKRLRKVEKPRDQDPDTVEKIPAGDWSSPEERVIGNERAALVQKALDKLPESYRLPLIMQHYQRMSYREMAMALGIPEKTVAIRLYRAKNILRKILTGGDDGEMQAFASKAGEAAGRGVHV